jgi:hypothetical protein
MHLASSVIFGSGFESELEEGIFAFSWCQQAVPRPKSRYPPLESETEKIGSRGKEPQGQSQKTEPRRQGGEGKKSREDRAAKPGSRNIAEKKETETPAPEIINSARVGASNSP